MLVHNEGPRSSWKLAVVEEVIRGGDGLVRAAHIRTSTGYSKRPVNELYPLEITETTSFTRPASPGCPEHYSTTVINQTLDELQLLTL